MTWGVIERLETDEIASTVVPYNSLSEIVRSRVT